MSAIRSDASVLFASGLVASSWRTLICLDRNMFNALIVYLRLNNQKWLFEQTSPLPHSSEFSPTLFSPCRSFEHSSETHTLVLPHRRKSYSRQSKWENTNIGPMFRWSAECNWEGIWMWKRFSKTIRCLGFMELLWGGDVNTYLIFLQIFIQSPFCWIRFFIFTKFNYNNPNESSNHIFHWSGKLYKPIMEWCLPWI